MPKDSRLHIPALISSFGRIDGDSPAGLRAELSVTPSLLTATEQHMNNSKFPRQTESFGAE